MQNLIVRHIERQDITGVKTIYEGSLAASGTLQVPLSSIEHWETRFNKLDSNDYSLVAESQSEIVGHLSLWTLRNPRRKHVAQLGMAVKDTHHRLGIGSQLIASALELADNWLNLQRIELNVFTDNTPAISLYKKHDFLIEGEAKNFAFRYGKYANVYFMARVNE